MRNKNLWRTGILNLLFQVVLLVILYFWGNETQIMFSGIIRVVFCLIFVLIPCIIWTLFFYLQDRIEPEPTQYVIVAFLTGMALAGLVYIPLENEVLKFESWISTDYVSLIIGSVFLMGLIISFLFYVGLRYGFYLTKEFDEPVDGMVYGAFIGSGFAAVKSISFLFETKSITLFAAGYTTTVNILLFASIAALIGFYIGKAKFKKTGKNLNFIASILIGMILIGIYNISTNLIYLQGNSSGFFYSTIIPLIISIIMLIIIFVEMRSLTKKDLHQEIMIENNIDYPVFIFVIILLVPGIFYRYDYNKDLQFIHQKSGIHASYPRKLENSIQVQKTGLFDQILFKKEKTQSKGTSKSLYTLTLKSLPLDLNGFNASEFVSIPQTEYPLNREFMEVNGVKCVRLRYCSFITNENHEWYPNMLLNVLTLIPYNNQTIIFYFSSSNENFDEDIITYENILNSIQIKK